MCLAMAQAVSESPTSSGARLSWSPGSGPISAFPASHPRVMKVLIIFLMWNLSFQNQSFQEENEKTWVPQSTGIIRGTEFQTGSPTALPYRARTVHGWVDNAEPSLALGGPCLSIFCPERSFFPQQSCQRSQGPETSAGSWLMPMTHFKTLRLPSAPRSKQWGGAWTWPKGSVRPTLGLTYSGSPLQVTNHLWVRKLWERADQRLPK